MLEMEQRNHELEKELEATKMRHGEQMDEWEQFQRDLQVAVRVANDIKLEAETDIEKLQEGW